MTHLSVHEWGKVLVDTLASDDSFSRPQANQLLAAARQHPCAQVEATNILVDHHRYLRARQVVGVLAAQDCSLEILPKVDPESPDEAVPVVRSRLLHMLDVALKLGLSTGGSAEIARQSASLLDILIRIFADRLTAETRRGLPRRYMSDEEDLSALRGRLDVTRQFTAHAVRPDRVACRFDTLTSDTPLLRIMKACVVFLDRHARNFETRRRLHELRLVLADVSDLPVGRLPWGQVRIDRTNRRWESLLSLAKLFLRRDWQATHHRLDSAEGITLLFPMNDLFESYVAAQLRRALSDTGIEVVAQGGRLSCLGEWRAGEKCEGDVFQTRPDILLKRHGQIVAVIDTKWKALAKEPSDRKRGVSQSDVYQMMAYSRIYNCRNLMLLYPATPGTGSTIARNFGIHGGHERLTLARLDLSAEPRDIINSLSSLVQSAIPIQSSQPSPETSFAHT
ncbi:restriction endonuclease [Citromicrobium bathyomarinum]